MAKILVAGGAGFIGSHLCKRLLSLGYSVVCVDNLITGEERNIKEFLSNPNFSFLKIDITKSDDLQKALLEDKLDFIFHLASPASPNKNSPRSYINHPIETLLANSLGTFVLLEIAKEKGAGFLYASSSEVYGNPQVSPQNEEYFGYVNPVGVRSVYDEGKRFGEAITMAYVRRFGLDARIVRIFNTYGPMMQKDDGRVISNFIIQAITNNPITVFGDGTQTRSFCFVEDMIDGLIGVFLSKDAKGEVINLGNPNEITIIDLANIVKKIVGSSSEIVFKELPEDDPVRRKPDISKAQSLFGFSPKVGLEEGLRITAEYFRQENS
jgi:nucleoside-diphosphate-sugar epimerase